MKNSKALLKNAFEMFDIWGDEAVTDSGRSRTIIKTVDHNQLWESFEGVDSAALFVQRFAKGMSGQMSWMPVGLLRFMTSPTTYFKALYYTNGIVCYDEGAHYLEQEWLTYCHPMTVEEFRSRLSI